MTLVILYQSLRTEKFPVTDYAHGASIVNREGDDVLDYYYENPEKIDVI